MTTVGQVDLRITGDSRDFRRSMSNAERAADRSSARIVGGFSRVDAAAARSTRSIGMASAAMTALGAAAAAAFGAAAIGTIANFEQAMSTVAGVTGATAAQVQALESVAKKLGATTRFSASQAAEGMLFLARAGFTVDEVLQSIPGTLALAQAGNIELGRAADIASNALSGFNLPASEMQRILDILAVASNKANTDIVQLGEALKFAAPTAVALGLSVEETVAVIGKLSDAGIQAGLAGRGFQSLSTQFINQRGAIEALIGKYDLAEEGLANVIQRLVDAGITTEQVSKIFRAENVDVFTVLANTADAADGSIQELRTTLENAEGELAKLAKIMDDNLNGAILAAQSALEALILAFGELGVSSGVRKGLEGLADLLRLAARNADILAAAAVALTTRALIPLAVTGAVAAGGALTKLRAEADLAVLAMGRLTGAAAIAGRALSVFGGPITIAITAAAAAMAYLAINAENVADKISAAEGAIGDYNAKQREIEEDTEKLIGLQEDLSQAIENQADIAADTARIEIAAVRERIAANEELRDSYADLARQKIQSAREDTDARVLRNLAKRADTSFSGGIAGTPQTPEQQRALIDAQFQRFRDVLDRGGKLNSFDAKLFEDILDFKQAELRIQNLEDLLDRIAKGETKRPDRPDDGPTRTGGTDLDGPTDAEIEAEKRRKERYAQDRAAAEERRKLQKEEEAQVRAAEEERIARGRELLGIVEERQAMDVAMAQLATARAGTDRQAIVDAQNKVAQLRQEEFVRRRIADLIAANVKPAEATRRAEADAAALRAAGGFGFVSEEDQDLGFEDMKSRTKRALQEAIETGDWGQAFQDGIRSAASAGLNSAIEDAVDVLFDALKQIDFGGGGIFGSVARFFGGGRAAGGKVYRGAAYTVGELGPETFIPDTDGLIVPSQKVQGIDGAVMGSGAQSINITQVLNIPGDPGKETVDLVRQELANTMPSMRRMVRAEVSQGQTRGRF